MRRPLFGLLLFIFIALPPDSLRLTPIGELAAPQTFSLLSWEVRSFPEKWLYRARHPTSPRSHEEHLANLNRYFELGGEQRRLLEQLERVTAETGGTSEETQAALQALQQVVTGRDALRRGVEEFLEGELSALLREEGLLMKPLGVELQFPPVDIHFTEPPRLLITSPRDQIQRQTDYLMDPRMTVPEMEALEERILKEYDLSALIEGLGGVATYPAAIPSTDDLRTALRVSAHEWLHHYLWFFPLGRGYGSSGEMRTLNESLADLVGNELGDTVFVRLGGQLPPEPPSEQLSDGEADEGFSFNREMRQTRLQADALLAEGKIEEAEEYMEERRKVMVENGFFLRKLNQAYFAFHGTYADSPASISPVADQLRSLRQHYDSLGAWVKTLAQVEKYEDFEQLLQQANVGD